MPGQVLEGASARFTLPEPAWHADCTRARHADGANPPDATEDTVATPTYTIRYTIGDKTLTLTERGRRDAKRRVAFCLKMAARYVGEFYAVHVKDDKGNVIGRNVEGRWL